MFAVNIYGTSHLQCQRHLRLIVTGTYSKDVPVNSTLMFHAQYGNSTPGITTHVNFCYVMEQVDQPDVHHQHHCPPKKGWSFTQQVAWTHPMFFNTPVSLERAACVLIPYTVTANIIADYSRGRTTSSSTLRLQMASASTVLRLP